MFLNNKYTQWYYSIIEASRNRIKEGYTESHHIIPKSLGGSNTPDNLVDLTAREHFICHLLLVKMVDGKAKYKMASALNKMISSNKHQKRIFTSWEYAIAKKLFSKNHPMKHPHIISNFMGKNNSMYGKKRPDLSEFNKTKSKNYQITNPNGEVFLITNLRKFCRENNLEKNRRQLIRGYYQYGNWKCERVA